MTSTPETRRASCHCGAVVLEAYLPQGMGGASRCDCSICRRRGPGAVTAVTGQVRILQGADKLALYTWNTHTAKHWFCRTCGIYTHHQRRSNPGECGINIGCIEGIDPRAFADLPWHDGINHPCDRPPEESS